MATERPGARSGQGWPTAWPGRPKSPPEMATASQPDRLLRASTYYDHASSMAPGTSNPERFHLLWERHREGWDNAIELFDPPVEKVEIPFESEALEGYFFHGGTSDERRPTIILNNGSDEPVISMWSLGGKSAVMRGGMRLHSMAPARAQRFIAKTCISGLHGRP